MKTKIFILLFAFIQLHQTNAQITFLGFKEKSCSDKLDYSVESFMCGSHSSSYRIYKSGSVVYEEPCISEIGNGKSVIDIQFLNDSVGFMVESYMNMNNMTPYKRIKKTINYGKTWTDFSAPPTNYGPIDFCSMFAINENFIIYVSSTYGNGPLPKHILINAINDTIKSDTVYHVQIEGTSKCNLNEINFSIKSNFDTIKYTIKLDFVNSNVSSFKSDLLLSVYPNPAYDYITITDNIQILIDSYIEIYDCYSKLVKIIPHIKNEKIFVGDIQSGIYFLKITSKQKTISSKMIKI